jgi:deoxycytidine triphosphate deaminase
MPLSALKILELNKEHNLIKGLSDRELNNPEGCGFDLRVGRVEKIDGESFLGVTERSSPKTELIGDIKKDGNKLIVMKPRDYFLVQTIEIITSPSKKVKYEEGLPLRYLMPLVFPRSSL